MAYTYNYNLNGEETIFKPQQMLFIFEFSVVSTALKFLIRERHLICMKCFFFLKGMTLVKRNASLPGVTEFCIVTVALLRLLNAIWSTLLSLQYCSECSSLYVYCIWVYGSKYPTIRTLCVLSLIILVMFCLIHAALTPLLIRQIYFYTHTHMHKRGN